MFCQPISLMRIFLEQTRPQRTQLSIRQGLAMPIQSLTEPHPLIGGQLLRLTQTLFAILPESLPFEYLAILLAHLEPTPPAQFDRNSHAA